MISEPYDSINIAQNLPSTIMREEPEVVAALASDDADVCGEVFSFCVCAMKPHGDDVAHACGSPLSPFSGVGCGGSWFGTDGTDSLRIVSYPGVPVPPLLGTDLEFLTATPITVRRGGLRAPLPLIMEVPAAEIPDMKPGHPAFDSAMERARSEGLLGLLLLPCEINFPVDRRDGRAVEVCPECSDEHCPLWLPLREEIAHSDIHRGDLARLELRQAHDISEVCTVCGGDGCGMFFCYMTGK